MGETRRTAIEFALVAGVGLAAGLTANGLHTDGIIISRNYFPTDRLSPRPVAVPATQPVAAHLDSLPGADRSGTQPAAEADPVDQAVRALGFQVISRDEFVALFNDPLYADRVYIAVDARDDEHYAQGHVPGAHQLDHYRRDRYIPDVLPACQVADRIVLYCDGGECEDSRLAAIGLRDDFGVLPEKLFIFTGGFEQWKAHHLPVETGPRANGQITGGGG